MPHQYIVRQEGTFKGKPETHFFMEWVDMGPFGRSSHWTFHRAQAQTFPKQAAERIAIQVGGVIEKA